MKKIYTGTKFQSIRRRIRAGNARFKKLTKAQQRIAIAKDVIKQVAAKEIQASSTYLTSRTFNLAAYNMEIAKREDSFAGVDTGEALCMEKCEVCGIGGLFVAAVKKADNLPFTDFVNQADDDGVRPAQVEYLEKWFSAETLDRVESYFEGHTWDDDSPIRMEDNDNKRLIMIMENIISNKGEFNPRKGAHGSS